MKTRTYEGVQHGDWVRCTQCGVQMLLPRGADQCPECYGYDTLVWVDEDRQEMDTKHLNTHVDWEQRRYEIAKTILPITSVSGRGPHGELILEACDKAAELAVIYADALIKELK